MKHIGCVAVAVLLAQLVMAFAQMKMDTSTVRAACPAIQRICFSIWRSFPWVYFPRGCALKSPPPPTPPHTELQEAEEHQDAELGASVHRRHRHRRPVPCEL